MVPHHTRPSLKTFPMWAQESGPTLHSRDPFPRNVYLPGLGPEAYGARSGRTVIQASSSGSGGEGAGGQRRGVGRRHRAGVVEGSGVGPR